MITSVEIKKINDEVFIAEDNVVKLDQQAITFIKEMARISPRGRARICAHQDPSDNLHEMIIAIQSGTYIRPHRHHNKIESFHLIEGRADVVILDEQGEIEEIVPLSVEHCFYYRLNVLRYHTLIIHSPVLVIHEITNGPFDANTSNFAPYAPLEENIHAAAIYMKELATRVLSCQ